MSVFAGIIASAAGIDDLTSPAIWDKSQFRIFCLLGALGGSFLSIVLFPPKETSGNLHRKLAIKFLASGLAGLLFTPIVIRWQGWPVDVDVVLAVSSLVAITGVSVISAVIPIFERRFIAKLTNELPPPPTPPSQSAGNEPPTS